LPAENGNISFYDILARQERGNVFRCGATIFTIMAKKAKQWQNLKLASYYQILTCFLICDALLVFSHMKIGMGEIFEDYIQDSRYKSVANLIISIFATVLPLITIVSLILIKFN
jgi:succinate dehydrogenase hydrophobic anchor subunit